MIKPFADDKNSFSIGDLSAENGTTAVTLSGSLAVTRDKQGLKNARALKQLADALVQALEEAGDLPDKVEATTKPDDKIRNPFA